MLCTLLSLSRIAHAVRGLKSVILMMVMIYRRSHRSRGAWIEIERSVTFSLKVKSHRSRGAWIEMSSAITGDKNKGVASLTRCVD